MTGLVGRMFSEFAADAHHRCRGFGGGVADTDADDVRSAPAAGRREAEQSEPSRAPSTGASMASSMLYRITLEWVLRHQPATLLRHLPARSRSRSGSTSSSPRASCPMQDTGLVTAVLEAEPQVSFTELVERAAAGCRCGEDATRRSPASSPLAGVGTLNTTPNSRDRLTITLKPRDQRKRAPSARSSSG